MEVFQETDLTQVDATGPAHISSALAVEMRHSFLLPEEEVPVDSVEFELPDGATGEIAAGEIVYLEGGYRSSYRYESAVDDFSDRFPPGEYSVTLRAEGGACVDSKSFLREDFVEAGSRRPKVLNQTWKDGKLHLPKAALVLRWERMEPGVYVAGDTESISQVQVFDVETGERVFWGATGELGNVEYAPFHVIGDQQGVFLSDQSDILEGKTYDVRLEKAQTTIIIEGDSEIEMMLISRVSFQVFVDPDAPVPPAPSVAIATDDEAGTMSISWIPDADTDYFVAADDGLNQSYIPGHPLDLLITPGDANSEISFTESISGDARGFFRVFPVPK